MKLRLLSALVGMAIVLPALFYGGVVAVEVLIGIVAVIAVREYQSMVLRERGGIGWLLGVGGFYYGWSLYGVDLGPGVLFAACGLLLLTVALVRAKDAESGMRHAAELLLGVFWIFVLLTHFPMVRRLDQGLDWIVLLLAVVWVGDAGAYFTGRALGKHKLYELISPNKTWEGVAGSLCTSVVAAVAVHRVLLPEVHVGHFVFLGLLISVVAVLGDLFESLVKRAAGVKDSGTIMPGHGGALDRIDSLLFGIATLHVYLRISGVA